MQTLTVTQVTPEELQALIESAVKRTLAGLQAVPATTQDEPLTIQEAAAFLGLSVATLYTNIKHIPHTKPGKRLYFFKSDLVEYLKGAKRKTAAEKHQDAEQAANAYLNRRKAA